MEIDVGEEVTITKKNSKLYIKFENNEGIIIIKPKSNISYIFMELEITSVEKNDNFKYITMLDKINQSDSYMFICVINTLINIDVFKNLFLSNEQIINISNNKEISNLFLDIIKKWNEWNKYPTKELKNLYENLKAKNIISESRIIIDFLIKRLFKEFERSNSICNLFYFKDRIYYICENCKSKYNNPGDDCLYLCLNFNLEYVIAAKTKTNIFFPNINIKDCFFHELRSRINNTYKCQSNPYHEIKYIYNVLIFPKLLIFTLDRGKNEAAYEDIAFDTEFELNLNYLEQNNQELKYKLIGIISYKKDAELGNKYYNVAFYKNTNKNVWCFYEKYAIREIADMNKDIIHTPYILFYLKE